MEVPYTPASVPAILLFSFYSFSYKVLFIIFIVQLVAISIGLLKSSGNTAVKQNCDQNSRLNIIHSEK